MSDKASRPGEGVFAVVLLASSSVAFWLAYEISGFSGLSTAGVFPMLASGTMVLSALCITARALRAPGSGERPMARLARFVHEVTPARHVVMLALIALYLVATPWLGFLVSSGLFLLASFAFLWRRNVIASLLLTAVCLGAIYVVFRIVFQVVLPQGTLLRGLF
jgi:hypothetical protein